MNYFVYLLKCADGRPYTGCTTNLEERLKRHEKGHVPATKSKLPTELVSYFAFKDKYTAYNFEKYVKSGSGRAFIHRHIFEKRV